METVCKFTDSCIYGSSAAGKSCDYIGQTGRSRVHNNPKGKIVDGKCGYYEEVPYERKRLRGKDAWDCPI